MRKSNTKKKHQQRDFYGKRDRALKLQRKNAKRSTSPMAKAAAPKKPSASREDLRAIEAIRACAADILKDCKTKPLNLYDVSGGFGGDGQNAGSGRLQLRPPYDQANRRFAKSIGG
jgi:hypothetical protein